MKYLLSLFLVLTAPQLIRAAQIDTLDVWSAAMQKYSRCVVVLPETYTLSAPAWPVLYLLHGWSGNYAGWLTDAPQLPALCDQHQVILVCPDGGYDSWYLDSPVDTSVRYDTYISRELVRYIDYYYHTRADKSGRAIAGLSMGGHGAITLAAKHPDVFGAAGSMSGGLDLRPFKANNWDLKSVLGDPDRFWQHWETNSAINMIEPLKTAAMPLMIDCGTEDFFIEVNRTMHRKLIEAGVPHEYIERPGEHNAAYWSYSIDFQLLFFNKYFKQHSGSK